jgi:hypothetical protein
MGLAHSKTHPWTPYEDQRLFAAVHRFGLHDWHAAAAFVGNGRSKSQCSQRWARGLDPRIDKAAWSGREDSHLLELIAKHGEGNWSVISREIGTRSDVQCRYRYTQLRKQRTFPEPICLHPPPVPAKGKEKKANQALIVDIGTTIVAPIVKLTEDPIEFGPVAKEVRLFDPLSPQGSSDSTSFLFSLSPANSFKFEP